jgi:hypothetical protein
VNKHGQEWNKIRRKVEDQRRRDRENYFYYDKESLSLLLDQDLYAALNICSSMRAVVGIVRSVKAKKIHGLLPAFYQGENHQ